MPKKYILEHHAPGKAKTFREFPTLNAAARTMQAEYFDELGNDSHAANADEKDHSFVICSHAALIRWRKGFQYKWNIVTKR